MFLHKASGILGKVNTHLDTLLYGAKIPLEDTTSFNFGAWLSIHFVPPVYVLISPQGP